jgi:hypothetical protein
MKCSMGCSPDELIKAGEKEYLLTVVIRDGEKASIGVNDRCFSTEKNLQNKIDYIKGFIRPPLNNGEVAYEEIKISTIDAQRKIFSRYGLKFPEPEPPTIEEWSGVLDRMVELAKKQSFVTSAHLVGSLAKGLTGRDLDIAIFVKECPGYKNCEFFKKLICSDPRYMDSRVMITDPNFELVKETDGKKHNYDVHLTCIDDTIPIESLKINKNKKTLYKKS